MIVLVPIDENGEDGAPVRLDQPRIRVGRGPHNDLILDDTDQAASYEHAMISVLDDRAVVVCELTANPTYIDGADVSLAPEEERRLKPGDIISFGKGTSIFRVSRIGELAEPRRVSHHKARALPHPKHEKVESARRGSSSPPPLRARHEAPERGAYPIVFLVFKGDRMVREAVFNQPLIRIGRMKSSHLLLDDESVSRTHAVVEVTEAGEVLLLDLDSSSGTAVAGQRVKKALLKSGDQIEFGKARVIVSYGETAARGAATPPAQAASAKAAPPGAGSAPPADDSQFAPNFTEVLSPEQLEPIDGPRLLVRRGGAKQDEVALTKPCTTIGRLPENDIQLDDGAVSGKHAVLVAEAGAFLIIDQHSTNGTHLNGKKCVGESLRHGDVIQIGRFELVFVLPQPGLALRPPGTEVLSPETARAMFAKIAGPSGESK